MKKSRMLAATLCAVLMVGVLTVPAYAGGGDEGGEYVPWIGLEPVESLPVEQPPDPKPFTPEGTGPFQHQHHPDLYHGDGRGA